MRQLVIGASLFFLSSLAFCEEVELSLKIFPANVRDVSQIQFEVNKDLGRAWVTWTALENIEDSVGYEDRMLINGLFFNKETVIKLALRVDAEALPSADVSR